MKIHAATLCAALAFSGCMSPRPDIPKAAALTVPVDWRASRGFGDPVTREWWKSFDDPVLSRLVEVALAENDDIAVAASRVLEARAEQAAVRALYLPKADFGSLGARERIVSPFGTPWEQTEGGYSLDVSYDADLFGRLKSANAAARAALLASAASRDAVKLAVAATVASGYINLRALDAQLATERKTLLSRAGSLQIARRQANIGYTSMLELHQAEAEYNATLQLVPAAELAVTKQENALSVLLGDSPHAISRGSTLDALNVPGIPEELPADVLRHRPDIFAAEEQLVAADRSLDSARAAFLPDLRLTASAGRAFSTLADPITVWSVGGSVLAPIFEGGRLHAQGDSASARRDQAAFFYRKTALTAFQEVEDGMVAVRRADQEVEALKSQCDALAQTLRVATDRYRAGYSPYLDQLDAQRGLLNAELSLIQVRAARLGAYVNLYRAMGGAWQLR
ncbi:MAG: outer membrane protein multidrug efflux system [Gammaproteobacteria bacterium]|nr:outer membrane protein multidrug efflux system [Gammaproteobacteria bacterium]